MKSLFNHCRRLIIIGSVESNHILNVNRMSSEGKSKLSKQSSKAPANSKRKLKEGEQTSKKLKTSAQAEASSSSSKSQGGSTVRRDKFGKLVFEDFPEFKPNLTPKEVLQAGSFGGTYFRPISSTVTGQSYNSDVWKEFPADWFEGLNIKRQVTSTIYRTEVNKYGAKCGGSLEMWESSGWIVKQDPYGWFQWYCRFFLGRRTDDDMRQIGRWSRCAGDKGRWRNNLVTKVVRSGSSFDNPSVSPVVRQTLQHWGYCLTEEDFKKQAKVVRKRMSK